MYIFEGIKKIHMPYILSYYHFELEKCSPYTEMLKRYLKSWAR